MSLWVKICGNTSLEDAQLAADAGANAAGFVFAHSPRQITPQQVAEIIPHLPAELEKIGVFVDASFTEIASIVEQCGLTGVQLHSAEQQNVAARLRDRFGVPLRILQVIHFGEGAVEGLHQAVANPNLDGVLVDSRTANALGGTGIAFDWQAAREQIFGGRHALKLIAAGGLNPGNVAEAIFTLQPWGVDVVTGVEAAPGQKDPEKVRAFVARARAAAAQEPAQSVH
jgi:phosphoribosylanthranilate isomerase